MATNRWIGASSTVAQVTTITPVAANAATYTIGIPNTTTGRTVSYVSDASATVAEITAGLVAAAQASEDGEFQEITWADGTTVLTATSSVPGTPHTIACTASAGSLTPSVTTANSSPHDLNSANNWSAGTVPAATEDVIFDAGNVDVLYNLGALSAVALTSLKKYSTYTGKIALPEYNEDGNYFEYRATELAIQSTTFYLEMTGDEDAGSIKINAGSATATTLTVVAPEGGPVTLGEEPVWYRCTNATSVVNVSGSGVAVAPVAGNSATVSTAKAENATLRLGPGCTNTTISTYSSDCELNSNVTTFNKHGAEGTLYAKQATTITTWNNYDGLTYWMSTGNVPSHTMGTGATIDFTKDPRSRSAGGTITMRSGSTWNDPNGTVSSVTITGDGVLGQEYFVITATGKTYAIS